MAPMAAASARRPAAPACARHAARGRRLYTPPRPAPRAPSPPAPPPPLPFPLPLALLYARCSETFSSYVHPRACRSAAPASAHAGGTAALRPPHRLLAGAGGKGSKCSPAQAQAQASPRAPRPRAESRGATRRRRAAARAARPTAPATAPASVAPVSAPGPTRTCWSPFRFSSELRWGTGAQRRGTSALQASWCARGYAGGVRTTLSAAARAAAAWSVARSRTGPSSPARSRQAICTARSDTSLPQHARRAAREHSARGPGGGACAGVRGARDAPVGARGSARGG